jgi:hypothetical protein
MRGMRMRRVPCAAVRTVRPALYGAGLLMVSACAARSTTQASDMGGGGVQTAVLQNTQGATRGLNMVSLTEVNNSLVNAPVERTWAALQQVYTTLNIPIGELDQASRTIGNSVLRIRRRIGDVPTMRALDCGGDSGMPNAETYQLLLTLKSRVISNDAGGSVVQTTLEGTGRNPTTSASSDVRCSSKGVLEKRIADLVKEVVTTK